MTKVALSDQEFYEYPDGIDSAKTELIPSEIDLPENHAQNSDFVRDLREMRTSAVAIANAMPQRDFQICRFASEGLTNKEIAERIGFSTQVVRKAINSQAGQQLISLLRLIQMTIDGVTPAHRKNFLWNIAQRNELKDARISISAVSEINKMEHNKAMIDSGQAGNNTKVEIVINSAQLPRGPLDV